MSNEIAKRTIRVELLRHEKTGLLAAVSPDLAGLVIHAQSAEEISARLPSVIRDLLEAEGNQVVEVAMRPDERLSRAGWGLPAFIASAAVAAHRDA